MAASYGPNDGSAARRSAETCAGKFLDLSWLGDVESAKAVAAERPEIFVDLMAHTTGARWTILDGTYGAHRNLYISLCFTHNIWSCLLWPSVIVVVP